MESRKVLALRVGTAVIKHRKCNLVHSIRLLKVCPLSMEKQGEYEPLRL